MQLPQRNRGLIDRFGLVCDKKPKFEESGEGARHQNPTKRRGSFEIFHSDCIGHRRYEAKAERLRILRKAGPIRTGGPVEGRERAEFQFSGAGGRRAGGAH